MRDVNTVTVTGTVEDIRTIPLRDGSGSGARMFLKCSRGSKSGDDRFGVVAWDQAASDALAIGSGVRVRIEGRLRRNSWTDKTDGTRKFDTEIVASSVVLAEAAHEEVY